MKPQEIRELSLDEIQEKYENAKKELFTLRFQAKTGKLEKQGRMKFLKRDIARLLTIKNEIAKKSS